MSTNKSSIGLVLETTPPNLRKKCEFVNKFHALKLQHVLSNSYRVAIIDQVF